MSSATALPESCGVAFKEWSGVCEAIADGRQTLILRKGGIAEGPTGFVPEHAAFWLYPTRVHEAQQGLRVDVGRAEDDPAVAQIVRIGIFVVLETISYLNHLEALAGLEEFHVWTTETLLKRFEYRRPGLWVLSVRAFRGPHAHKIPLTADQTGCKSWVPIEPPLSTDGLEPVLNDAEHAIRLERLTALLKAA